jgi:hypothetical protein
MDYQYLLLLLAILGDGGGRAVRDFPSPTADPVPEVI